jgi:hypothetical protein
VLNSFMGHASANKDTQNVRLHIMLLPQLTAYDLHSKPSSTSTYILKICERARSALKQSTMRKQTGAQLLGEESLRHCAMPALNKGRLEACWRLAEGLRAKRLLNFPINFLPVIGYPANARKAAGKMPWKVSTIQNAPHASPPPLTARLSHNKTAIPFPSDRLSHILCPPINNIPATPLFNSKS